MKRQCGRRRKQLVTERGRAATALAIQAQAALKLDPTSEEARDLLGRLHDQVCTIGRNLTWRHVKAHGYERYVDDLDQESFFAMVSAVGTFDPARGEFATHYGLILRARNLRMSRQLAATIRVPDHARFKDRGRPNKEIHCDVHAVPLTDTLAVGLAAPGDDSRAADSVDVERYLSRLEPHQRDVVRRRFGLGDAPQETLKEIAKRLRANQGTIANHYSQAIKILRAEFGVEEVAPPHGRAASPVARAARRREAREQRKAKERSIAS